MWRKIGLCYGLFAVACASVPPMSATEHDQMAAEETATAKADQHRYDPSLTQEIRHCGPYTEGGTTVAPPDPFPCWSEFVNPTSKYLAEAREHERIAQAHEAASQRLKDQEAKACVGIGEGDRHTSPFERVQDIVAVTIDSDTPHVPIGATVVFGPVPGMTAEWLQRVIDCHLAIDAELGHDVPEHADCPLVPAGVTAHVVQDGNRVKVVLRAQLRSVVDEVVARVERLQQRRTEVSPPVSQAP